MTPERYAQRRAAGLCSHCPRPSEDASRCLDCRRREATYSATYETRTRVPGRRAQYETKQYQQRRARGICSRCPNPSPDHSRCLACRRVESLKAQARRKRARAQRVDEIRQAMPRIVSSGKRADLNGLYVRSSWEANYARYLNWLQSLGEIDKWDYEPDTFAFDKIKRGTRFYTPDFRVRLTNGAIEYHEVKGYMNPQSATKLKRMAKYYPQIKVVLVDGPVYRSISKKVRSMIANWEGKS